MTENEWDKLLKIEYITQLMQDEVISFYDEISCEDLFQGKNERERILIFSTMN